MKVVGIVYEHRFVCNSYQEAGVFFCRGRVTQTLGNGSNHGQGRAGLLMEASFRLPGNMGGTYLQLTR